MKPKSKEFDYKVLSHTADFAVNFYGKTVDDFFKSIVLFFNKEIYEDTGEKGDIKKVVLKNEEENLSYFIIEILNEIIYFSEKGFKIKEIKYIESGKFAELNFFKYKRLNLKTELKAATYHNLELIEKIDKINLTVVFDL